jgi:hypothetical protein
MYIWLNSISRISFQKVPLKSLLLVRFLLEFVLYVINILLNRKCLFHDIVYNVPKVSLYGTYFINIYAVMHIYSV